MDKPHYASTHLTWGNVAFGFGFVVFDAVFACVVGLGVGGSLLTSAIRCIVQLEIMALILQRVFDADNPWGVAGLACKYRRRDNLQEGLRHTSSAQSYRNCRSWYVP